VRVVSPLLMSSLATVYRLQCAREAPGEESEGRQRWRPPLDHTREGADAAFRPYLRAFRGVYKQYLYLSVAAYEAMANAKRATPALIQRICVSHMSMHIGYT
jgi:hypothetical protein